MLISPAEPKAIRILGTNSSVCERFGADILFPIPNFGMVGVQRKETKDLVASLRDGRLGKELLQLKTLRLGVLIVEGKWKWGLDGQLLDSYSDFSKAQLEGVVFSVCEAGLWVLQSDSISDTVSMVRHLESWLCNRAKDAGKLSSLFRRPNPTGAWGQADNRDWGIHLLQSFNGIGIETAASIFDRYGVPLCWTVTEKELMTIPGIGKGRARSLIAALNGSLQEPLV